MNPLQSQVEMTPEHLLRLYIIFSIEKKEN